MWHHILENEDDASLQIWRLKIDRLPYNTCVFLEFVLKNSITDEIRNDDVMSTTLISSFKNGDEGK